VLDAGFTGVIVMSGPRPGTSDTAVGTYRDAGLDVLLAWDPGARRELAGRQAGEQDGALADALARGSGYPDRCAVYLALSLDAASPGELRAVEAYLCGFAALCGRPSGVRGSARLVEAALGGDGLMSYGWQTQAWSGGYVSPLAHLYQRAIAHPGRLGAPALRAGHENTVLQRDCGAWGVHGPAAQEAERGRG
jgi:hypothetical protein